MLSSRVVVDYQLTQLANFEYIKLQLVELIELQLTFLNRNVVV